MESRAALTMLLLVCGLQGSLSLDCYRCEHNEIAGSPLDEECLGDRDSIESEPFSCASDEDICYSKYIVDENGKEHYERDCADASDFNDELDKCYKYELFGKEFTECTCQTDECNGASSASAALALTAAAVVLRKLVE